ncbi:NAD(P)-binding protein [Hypoxylon sp. FL0543]|nr:NAD(P)-binding protein [Hypoxylon sp. FL0543]
MSHHLESQSPFHSHFFGFLYRQWLLHRKPIPTGTTLSGQTAIVTGANSGLGFEAARQLLRVGLSHLIVAVRSQSRGDAATQKLRREFPDSTISVWLLDMASYDSVRAFAARCRTLPRIDIVLLNAGVRSDYFELTESTHHEVAFQVNYLSTTLLAILLLPVLKSKKSSLPDARPPRLSIVTSDTAYWAPPLKTPGPIIAQFDDPTDFVPMTSYSRSKLMQQYFVSMLAEHVSPDDVIISTCNPGLCKATGFGHDATQGFIGSIIFWIFQNLNGRAVEVGTSAVVDAVVMKGKESHGSYVSDWTIQPYPVFFYTKEGQELRKRIWEETMEEFNFAGASQIVQEMKR